jgi:NAD(P)-dependent dehydrogenase (short-subunit alcohol dehydrogenase family)
MASTVTNIFGATSTTEDVLSGIDLRGKRILVTGVSAGLGVETARSLAADGAHVIGAARDLAKAENATTQVRKDATVGSGSFELIELDLASLQNVRACADGLLAKGESLDAIIAIITPELWPHPLATLPMGSRPSSAPITWATLSW